MEGGEGVFWGGGGGGGGNVSVKELIVRDTKRQMERSSVSGVS